jgi:ADP-heptose:LPS heptosyltransferase
MSRTRSGPSRILVLRTDHLGDAILTTPLLRALAKSGNTVEFMVHDAFLELFTNNPHISACHGLDSVCPDLARNWRQLASWIRQRDYDALVLPFGWPKQLLFASFFSGVRRRLAAHSQFWGNLTLHTCPQLRLRFGLQPYPEAILVFADLLGAPRDGIETDLLVPEENVARVRSLLSARAPSGRWIGIHPGSGGSSCNFPPCGYEAMLSRLMAETDYHFVLTGTAAERRLVASWAPALVQSSRVWNSMGEISLRDVAALLQQLDLYICPSTATLHIAGAFRTPTLSPFCPVPCMRPQVWGPQTGQARFLMPERAQCPPSTLRKTSTCDFSGKISPDDVVSAALRILAGKSIQPSTASPADDIT